MIFLQVELFFLLYILIYFIVYKNLGQIKESATQSLSLDAKKHMEYFETGKVLGLIKIVDVEVLWWLSGIVIDL